MPERMPATVRRWCLAAAVACLVPLLLQLTPGLALGLAAVAVLGIALPRPLPTLLRLVVLLLAVGYVLASHDFSPGRDTGCALLAALLTLKFFETHHLRDARSLLGFSLFAPFAAFLQDQGPLTLALALPAMGLLLVALSVVAEQRPGAPAPAMDRPRLATVGLAVVMALPLALAAFWLFPRLGSPLWGLPENSLGRSGLGDRMSPDEWVEMFADDAPALRVRFRGAEPARQDLYWRGQVLWDFDGQTWSRGTSGELGAVPVLRARGDAIAYDMSLEPTDRNYLITLDLPLEAPTAGRLASDLSAIASEPVTSLLKYSGLSSPDAAGEAPLSPEHARAALSLPRDVNPRMRALAARWRDETGGRDVELVRKALAWMGEEFSYSLTVPPGGRHAVDDFLFDSQVGFCQHFSSAFANLMRAAGVPARVVLGYAGGYRNAYGDYWVVRRMDAHAWVEVWLDGRGWTRVDPTAAVAPERVLDTVADLARQEALLPDGFAPLLDLGDWARRSWNELVLGFNAQRQASLLRPLGIDQASAAQLGAAFAVGAGLALGVTLWLLLRGQPARRHPVERAWRGFTRRLRRAGLAKAASEPPLQYGARLARALPGQAGPLASLSQGYAAWRYAPAGLSSDEQARLIADLRRFRPAAAPS